MAYDENTMADSAFTSRKAPRRCGIDEKKEARKLMPLTSTISFGKPVRARRLHLVKPGSIAARRICGSKLSSAALSRVLSPNTLARSPDRSTSSEMWSKAASSTTEKFAELIKFAVSESKVLNVSSAPGMDKPFDESGIAMLIGGRWRFGGGVTRSPA